MIERPAALCDTADIVREEDFSTTIALRLQTVPLQFHLGIRLIVMGRPKGQGAAHAELHGVAEHAFCTRR